jgi:hypothetical protein
MNILLTASLDRGLFCNGLQQNIIFLAQLIAELGHTPIIAVNHDIDDCVDPPSNIIIIEEKEIEDLVAIDYILQTGWVVRDKHVDYLKAENSRCKNIHIHYGNRLLADVEQCKSDNISIPPYRTDEVWASPHYKFSFEYYKTFYKTERVFELPYIWSPQFANWHNDILKKTGKTCEYDPSRPKNIAIMEPNLNMTKNCIPSIFIVEEAYRKDPNLFNQLTVYCSTSIREKKYFRSMMWQLDIVRNNKVEFGARQKFSVIFSQQSNVVVSHQLLNALNYTYLEALHFNIPLVHNSEFIKDAGYYYPDYETIKGGDALYEALTYHDKNLEQYRETAQRIIYNYSPENPAVIERYKRLFV